MRQSLSHFAESIFLLVALQAVLHRQPPDVEAIQYDKWDIPTFVFDETMREGMLHVLESYMNTQWDLM